MFKQLANRRKVLAAALGWLLVLTVAAGFHVEAFGQEAEHDDRPVAKGAAGEHDAKAPPVEGASHDAGASHAAPGPIDWKTDLALWSLIVFVLFVVVLNKFAWKPLIAGLDKRELAIRSDIDAAEAARVKAERMFAEHKAKLDKVQDEIREILAEARRDAEYTRQEIVAAAEKEANLTRERASVEIERERAQALAELFAHMTSSVTAATEHVIGRSLGDGDHERLINEALAGFSGAKG